MIPCNKEHLVQSLTGSQYGLDAHWQEPTLLAAVTSSEPLSEDLPDFLTISLQAFLAAKASASPSNRLLSLWTALNALANHLALTFEVAQTKACRCNRDKLPARYRLYTIDSAVICALATVLNSEYDLPCFTQLNAGALKPLYYQTLEASAAIQAEYSTAPDAWWDIVKTFEAQQTSQNKVSFEQAYPQTFLIAKEANAHGVSARVFLLLVVPYHLRNALVHGSAPQALPPYETSELVPQLKLFSNILEYFLNDAIYQAFMQQSEDFEPTRKIIEHYCNHRFDGMGLTGFLQKHGLM